jgi:tetratricopeptide (TPR) repeat protein
MFETPFNISCYYGDNLQDYPNNPAEMRQAVDYWEAQLTQPELDIRDRIRLLTRIGTYARTLRDLDRAEEAHKAAIELAKSIDNVRLKTQNRIKLAHVYQWQQQYAESEAVFEAMIATCQHEPEVADFLDFAYQHYGKCKFDQQRYAEALQLFEQALELRHSKGNQELIDSTELAIATAKARYP